MRAFLFVPDAAHILYGCKSASASHESRYPRPVIARSRRRRGNPVASRAAFWIASLTLAMTALLCDHRCFGGHLLGLSTKLEVQADGENIDAAFGVGGKDKRGI